jgi:hypothetical protein
MQLTSQRLHPAVESLECRDVPAVNVTLQNGTLFLDGTNQADTVLLLTQGNRLVVSQPGIGDQFFPLRAVRDVFVRGSFGADSFVNLTNLRTVGFGGPGDDLLFGGFNRNRLLGEAGNDTLVGGPLDRLNGGGGLNFTALAQAFFNSGGLDGFFQSFGDGLDGRFLSPVLQTALAGFPIGNTTFGISSVSSGFFTSPGTFTGLTPFNPLGSTSTLSPTSTSGSSSFGLPNPDANVSGLNPFF